MPGSDLLREAASADLERPRKRSHHRPTEATRADVRDRVSAGQSTAEIANVYGISPPTLRAHYRRELGRSHHVPSQEIRDRIAAAVSAGRSVAEIAASVGLSRAVIFRCYRIEIGPALCGGHRA